MLRYGKFVTVLQVHDEQVLDNLYFMKLQNQIGATSIACQIAQALDELDLGQTLLLLRVLCLVVDEHMLRLVRIHLVVAKSEVLEQLVALIFPLNLLDPCLGMIYHFLSYLTFCALSLALFVIEEMVYVVYFF